MEGKIVSFKIYGPSCVYVHKGFANFKRERMQIYGEPKAGFVDHAFRLHLL
jgi:hypothetical protein